MRFQLMQHVRLALGVLLATASSSVIGQVPFFPGAEGFGGSFTGTAPAAGWFSDATVYHVTNLNDSGAGSFRDAFKEKTSNRIIVFDVAGTIQLTSDSLDIKNLSNYYIAGQTAPGEVTLTGDTVQITHSNNYDNSNIVLRYMTFRKGTGNGSDAITFAGGNSATPTNVGTNMILDHVTATWAEDENLSIANNNTNITVQYSLIADATGGSHSYGTLARTRSDASVSIHHNLYANNESRQPRLGTYNESLLTADVRNNVVYNWGGRATYAGGSSESETEHVDVNYVGNYLVAGPWSASNATKAFIIDKNTDVEAYQSGNFIDSDRALNPSGEPNGADTGWNMFQLQTTSPQSTLTQRATPVATAPVTTQSALDAYRSIVAHAGNSAWGRDAIDQRIISNLVNNTAPANGPQPDAPLPAELAMVNGATASYHPAGYDTDGDAMPDAWEIAHGLNPNSAADWNLDFDTDGYINLIEFINERGEFPASAPIVFTGDAGTRFARIENWRTDDGGVTAGSLWQPSRHDLAIIRNADVVVDAVGQHAGLLKIGGAPGDDASLTISNGWLDTAEGVVIGDVDGAVADLSITGGLLVAPSLTKGIGGTLSFTGGELVTEAVGFDLTVAGGKLSPGLGIGGLDIDGDLSLSTGALEIELAAAMQDAVTVTGTATLGGALEVTLRDGFAPTAGAWKVLTADEVVGDFSSITAGFSAVTVGDSVWVAVGLAGDFNGDGAVDAADYTVWRDGLGSVYSAQDYYLWAANYGATAAANPGTSVPEPAALVGAVLMGLLSTLRRSYREPV
ncbi:hypothetical protein Pla108_18030 [Botrimarina colliarenosi]|uniref:Probable pectate lyase C n=1 Tax=Botrimarina colliarenosi TaxID=2528001 RepID=A0A5C6AF13_9BACT|nr:hypothetical protein [Botrimarina colliarenosi]TWT97651.1 hypothetical protein Pla108_18030 [Botrimarina colliarenosi]